MEIRILGRLEVRDGIGPVDIRRPKERALLTLLAAEAGRVVSTDRLLDGLWGEQLPATATKTLQTYIHHLRSLLPQGTIATDGSGYRLNVPPENVDAHRFVEAVEQGQALRRDDPATAAQLLEEALATWRGTPAADAPEAEGLRQFRTRLEGMRLEATADWIDTQITLGRHEAVIPRLRGLVEEFPLREDLWAHLMLALYRSGRQAEALRAFGAARSRLAQELGIEPGPELRTLEDRILAQDPALATVESAASGPNVEPPDAPPTADQRLVTMVLAELDGDGGLEASVDPRTAAGIRSEAVGAMAAVVEQLGGSIASRWERGVVACFGTPVAREDDTYRAIRAGLLIRSDVAAKGRDIERSWGVEGLTTRVAAETLPVVVPLAHDDDISAVRERMSGMLELARGGGVVVDDHSHSVMGELFSWDESPRLGDGDGLVVWGVKGVRAGTGKARMGRRVRSPLVGRVEELARAGETIAALARGMGGAMIVAGDAGVGKTRLLDELQASAGEVAWMVGHCAPYAEAIPYWPFRDMVRSWLGLGVDDTEMKTRVSLRERLEALDHEAAGDQFSYLGGLLGLALDPSDAVRLRVAPEALQFRTFEVMRELIAALAQRSPLVIAVEDVHWADPTSLQLLEHLVPLTETHALLIIVTTRIAPNHASHRLWELVRRRIPHRSSEMALATLADDAQHAMLSALVGSETLPPAMAQRVLTLAEGNPFYLEELVGSLIDEGALVPTGTGWQFDHEVALSVPETVEKVVQSRIDRLDSPAHDLITCAAVLGRRFGLPLLQGVIGENENLMEALQELLRLELLIEARRWPQAEYVFKHALIQEAAHRTLLPDRRAALHRTAAEWLERRFEGSEDEVAGLLATHWAAAGDEERASTALVRAGDLARRDHALDEAIEHYRTLLGMLDRRGDKRSMAIVLFKLALALHTALRFAESNSAYQRAFELWEPGSSAPPTATLRFGGGRFFRPADPVRSYFLSDMQLQMALFDRMVERWPDDTLVPSLAERWEVSDDGLRYRFTLRPDIEWSDGVPLTAHDVVHGILRNLDPDQPGISVAMLYVIEGAKDAVLNRTGTDDVGVAALDDRTIEFRLVAPAPYFLSMLNRPDCGPQPRHAIARFGEEWSTAGNEVVSGAFHRRKHGGDRVVLERREGYAGSRSGNVKTVEWHTDPAAEAIDAYLHGRRDLLWITAGSDGSGLERVPENEVFLEPPAGLVYMVIEHRTPAMADRRFRLALAHAIDRSALRDALPSHAAPATGGVVPPALAGHTPDVAPGFDPAKARSLFAEADAPRKLSIGVLDLPGFFYARLAEAVGEMWQAHLGLDVDVAKSDRDSFTGQGHDARPEVYISYWYPGFTDPEYFLRLLLHSEAADNFGQFSHSPYDELIAQAAEARDERTRLSYFHAADRMAVAEQVAAIPLAYTRNISVRSPELHGWWEFGKSWSNFADLTLDRRAYDA